MFKGERRDGGETDTSRLPVAVMTADVPTFSSFLFIYLLFIYSYIIFVVRVCLSLYTNLGNGCGRISFIYYIDIIYF